MQYTTAYGALIDIAKIKKGDFVVIPAASSSVGLAAIELCNLNGATPIATTRKKSKKEALQKAGAKHVIVTEEENLVEQIHEITKGRGSRVVFDPVGGKAVFGISQRDGVRRHSISIWSSLVPILPHFPLFEAMSKSLNMRGYTLMEICQDSDRFEKAKQYILNALESKKLKPIIAKKFPLDKIVDAHRYLESNEQFGKIVVTV